MGRVLKDLLLGLGLACALQTPTRTVRSNRAPQIGGGQTFDATVGARALFALVVGALDVFNSLADDLNDPFRSQFTLESTTVSASLQQLRARIRAAVREEVPRPPEA